MSGPMTAADYADWLRYAGLYLHNISHADRYRTYQGKISRAGLAIAIVLDFLESHQGGIDLQTWRNSDVYEMAPDAAYRIEQSALAMEALGAPRIAAKMRTLRNTSISGLFEQAGDFHAFQERMKQVDPAKMIEEFRANLARAMPDMAAQAGIPNPTKPVPMDQDIETWEEIEHRLGQFVQAHQRALQADIDEHGDPRAEPGFDPTRHHAELERLRMLDIDRERQKEIAPKMFALIEAIDTQIAKNPKLKPGKIAKERRELLDAYRRYVTRPPGELLPDTQKWLQKADGLQTKHVAQFRPQPIDDDAILQRLASLGAYEIDMGNKKARLIWHTMDGVACKWTSFTVSLTYPLNDAAALEKILDALDRLRNQFPSHLDQMRAEILQSFGFHHEMLARWGFEGYERGPDGEPTEQSILTHGGEGNIHLSVSDDGDVMIQANFPVDWDDEHGLECYLPDE